MITLSEINQAYRNASEPERQEFIELILPKVIESPVFEAKVTVIVEKVLKNSFDARLAISELRPIQRIAELELVTGLDNYYEDEDHEPTISERIESLENKLSDLESQPSESSYIEIKPKTKTGTRALHLITKLKASGKNHLTHKEIKSILTEELPEDCRIDAKSSNPRKMIIDVLKEAETICADIFLDKKAKGHREWRMGLKS